MCVEPWSGAISSGAGSTSADSREKATELAISLVRRQAVLGFVDTLPSKFNEDGTVNKKRATELTTEEILDYVCTPETDYRTDERTPLDYTIQSLLGIAASLVKYKIKNYVKFGSRQRFRKSEKQ